MCGDRAWDALRRLADRQNDGHQDRQAAARRRILRRDRRSDDALRGDVFGIPVSTTHTITGSIVGVGSAKRFSAVKWGVAGRIVWAWVLTIPMAGIIAALVLRRSAAHRKSSRHCLTADARIALSWQRSERLPLSIRQNVHMIFLWRQGSCQRVLEASRATSRRLSGHAGRRDLASGSRPHAKRTWAACRHPRPSLSA